MHLRKSPLVFTGYGEIQRNNYLSWNVLKLFLTACVSFNGLGGPRADMYCPQGDFGSMESHDSDQYGCNKQRSSHSESVIVTESPCALACEWQKGAEDFQLSACFWRGLTCYSNSIVKFALSGCLQINGLDQRNDVDKLQLDVKIYIPSQSCYLEFLSLEETKFTSRPSVTHCQTEEQQHDYKALKLSEVKWSSIACIRKPSHGYTWKAPLLQITSSVSDAWCLNVQEKN